MAIPNLKKLIAAKQSQLSQSNLQNENSKEQDEIIELFEGLFKFIDTNHNQTTDLLSAISHDQKELLSRIRKLEEKDVRPN